MTGPYWGSDKRVFPKLTAWIQNLGTFKSKIPPLQVVFEFLGMRLNVPMGDRWLVVRCHLWRWDAYNKAYIFFSAMAKRVDVTEVLP